MNLNTFAAIAYFMVMVGLLIDRYWLMPRRTLEDFIKKTNERGRCLICGRPLKIVPDWSDKEHDE